LSTSDEIESNRRLRGKKKSVFVLIKILYVII
jgi:hypothetical protein